MQIRFLRPGVVIALASLTAAPAAEPGKPSPAIPAKAVKLDDPNGDLGRIVAAISKQTGIPVTYPESAKSEGCDAIFNGTPFWDALEAVADRTGHRIALHENGRKVALEPRGKCKEVSAVSGPFRVVARQSGAKYNLELGQTVYEVQLDAHWEPRFPVFRIDVQPNVTKATDDRGTTLTAPAVKSRAHPGAGGFVHPMAVRLVGLTRDSRRVAVLAGDFGVTAAPEMLPFQFADLSAKGAAGKLPPAAAGRVKDKVTATLKRFALDKDTNTWEAEVEVTYPADQPRFESFESEWWLAENQLRLLAPDNKTSHLPDGYEYDIRDGGRRVVAVYRYKAEGLRDLTNAAAKGWSLVYETPAPLVEFRVPFELKDIPLP
jgi:hypothetical protein